MPRREVFPPQARVRKDMSWWLGHQLLTAARIIMVGREPEDCGWNDQLQRVQPTTAPTLLTDLGSGDPSRELVTTTLAELGPGWRRWSRWERPACRAIELDRPW